MAPTSASDVDLRVREALRSVAANVAQSVVTSTLGAVLLLLLLRHAISPWPATLWLGALVAVGTLRVRLRARVQHTDAADAQRACLKRFTVYAFASGLIWAAAPWVLATSDLRFQSVLLLSCVAIGAGGAFASLASLRTAFAVFWPPLLAPMLFGLVDGRDFFQVLAVVSLVLSVVLARMIVVLNRQFIEQVDLRARNAELLAELRQRTADAEAANEAKSRFLVAASHDLRQPMHALAIRSRALLEQNLPAAASQDARRLFDSVAALQSLFDALLDISKLDAGDVELAVAPFPLQDLFARLRSGYADIAAEQAVDLRIADCTLWVASDALLIERILRQLLDNAMRHAPGSLVQLCASADGQHVRIEISDTGKGIAIDQQQSIFKEFVQLENPQRDRRKGLGLGLAIVQRLARQLGHPLALQSEPGKGTCLRLLVPQVREHPASAGVTPSASVDAASPTPVSVGRESAALAGEPPLILLLDDDPDVLEAMSTLLSRWGCEVLAITHSNELDAVLAQHARPPDLLICDYRLAEPRNGRQIIDAMRERYTHDLPALLITGDIRSIEKAGDDREVIVLRKPVASTVLRDLITSLSGRTLPSAARAWRPQEDAADAGT